MDEMTRELIETEARWIRERSEGACIYGQLVDPEDADMALVAAYYVGRMSNRRVQAVYEGQVIRG